MINIGGITNINRTGYLGLQMLVGYSSTYKKEPIRTLAHEIEIWLNTHTGLISKITVTPKFYKALKKEVGYPVLHVDTLVATAELVVDNFQTEKIRIR